MTPIQSLIKEREAGIARFCPCEDCYFPGDLAAFHSESLRLVLEKVREEVRTMAAKWTNREWPSEVLEIMRDLDSFFSTLSPTPQELINKKDE